MSTPNAALARRTLSHIEAHPELWRQDSFASRLHCGTAYCFAGHAVMLTHPDAEPIFYEDDHVVDEVGWQVRIGGRIHSIPELAAQLLGLGFTSGWVLFDGGNDLDDLRDLVEQMEQPDFKGAFELVAADGDDE